MASRKSASRQSFRKPSRQSKWLEFRSAPAQSAADVFFVFQDASKKRVNLPAHSGPIGAEARAMLQHLEKAEAFAAKAGSVVFTRSVPPKAAILFVGLGAPGDLTLEKARQAGGNAWAKLSAEKTKVAQIMADAVLDARGIKAELSFARLVRAFLEGFMLAAYQFNKYKSGGSARGADAIPGPARIAIVSRDKTLKQQLELEASSLEAVADAVRITRDWSNEPSNIGTPEYYANEARKLARQHGLKARVLTLREAAREKMNLFLAVSQGSRREGRIVVLEYSPKGARAKKTVALVGKGVTFDSGGISIKPALRMEDMKHDMTGAATVMGAMVLAARWKVRNRIVAIMAFTENMPGGFAVQPGNIVRARNGKTVEIVNTDAEGRLILADVLDYAHEFKPDAIVNVATLTGAVSIALGKYCCAIMGNNDALIESIRRSGDLNGERIWQLPLFDEYLDDMKSDYADLRNVANDSNGGTIRGGIFLKQFIRPGTAWAHLDIAAMAYGITYLSYCPKRGASGIFVRTLAQLAADF